MPSTISWLDASSEEQRRMREIIRLFSDRDSRDELGFGQIRDALSNGLFPGTSVLLTRARYMLFVPWCYLLAADRPDPRAAAEQNERALINTLRETENLRGLLGARAGAELKTLPSNIYWTSLRTFGVVDESAETVADALRERVSAALEDGQSVQSGTRTWSPTLAGLPIPAGFPSSVPGDFDLTRAEAGWLRDRVRERVSGTLLAHLVEPGNAPDPSSEAPWTDAAVHRADAPVRDLVLMAERFSIAANGAALLYNLMLAEEHEKLLGEDPDGHIERYRNALDDWSASATTLLKWRPDELWNWLLGTAKARVSPTTRQFADRWVELLRSSALTHLAENNAARELVRTRERHQKKSLARLGNDARTRSWTGSSGAIPLTYRWGTVRNLLIDIHEGLDRDA